MSMVSDGKEFDLVPDPRILPMLGEINLAEWRCIAELVDNSVDAFLDAERSGNGVPGAEVHVSVPVSDDPSARVTVRDNGPGMVPEKLEKAVRAGWSGNEPLGSLGLFGMGFNIATARLGLVTEVWTTRRGDPQWTGLKIDFETLMRQRHFRTPQLSRPKTDPDEQGTEITITRLKPEQRSWFSRSANRSRLERELSRAYSTMLRPNGIPITFSLQLNGKSIRGREHCIWGQDRQVQIAKYGAIHAYQPVEVRLPDRLFCKRDWQWLPAGETLCPVCGSSQDVISRERRVQGWLGVQRYLSEDDYGIDFIRHGRKIEIQNKDLFYWNGGEVPELEYPIDDPRHRGRIVGEIHLDHCRVTYTKDRFDRNDPAWQEMVSVVRGEGPLRPEKAAQLGYGSNTSSLFCLYQAFRRSNPHARVAGAYSRLLVVKDNERAEEMAKRFYAGEPEYQSDTKWWELIQEADQELLIGSRPAALANPALTQFPQPSGPQTRAAIGPSVAQSPTIVTAPPARTPSPVLSREYVDSHSGLRWDVTAYHVEPSDPALGTASNPWSLKRTSQGPWEFFVNPAHDVFRSATMTPLDALLAELASSAVEFQRGSGASAPFSLILSGLRDRYAQATRLDSTSLSSEARQLLATIARSLSGQLPPDESVALFNDLSPADQETILRAMATRSVPGPQQALEGGRFLEFAPPALLARFFEEHPELFLDGRLWDDAYAGLDYGRPALTEEARRRVAKYYSTLLADVVWLAEQSLVDLDQASRERLLRAALAIDLLASSTSNGS